MGQGHIWQRLSQNQTKADCFGLVCMGANEFGWAKLGFSKTPEYFLV